MKESIIDFLNTWELPNDTRVPVDHLSMDKEDSYSEISQKEREEVVVFRDELRDVLQKETVEPLNKWMEKINVQIQVGRRAGKYTVSFQTEENSFLAGLLVEVLTEVENGNFHRYKVCPDCKWAFYDSSKSSTKKWCSMNKNSATGRACGTIAKVRRFREKEKS